MVLLAESVISVIDLLVVLRVRAPRQWPKHQLRLRLQEQSVVIHLCHPKLVTVLSILPEERPLNAPT